MEEEGEKDEAWRIKRRRMVFGSKSSEDEPKSKSSSEDEPKSKSSSDSSSKSSKSKSSKSEKSSKYKKMLESGEIPRDPKRRAKKESSSSNKSGVIPRGPKRRKESSSSNIESSSDKSLSNINFKPEYIYGPDSQRINKEVEAIIKRIEEKKK